MKNIIWKGMVETRIVSSDIAGGWSTLTVCRGPEEGVLCFINAGVSIDVHIDELREIVGRYDAHV